MGSDLNLTTIDRNRIVAAALLSAVMLPLVWLSSASSSGSPSGSSSDSAGGAAVTSTTYSIGLGLEGAADKPVNLDGPTGALAEGEGQIAYPADLTGSMIRGSASYKRFPQSATTGCYSAVAPLGAELRVFNRDNGRSIRCFNVNVGYVPAGQDIVISTTMFEKLADLVDSPIPVEITW